MNYQRIYDAIISNARSRGLNKKILFGYFERHHIIPKCLNGTNDKDNLVLLTGREHYLCHWLLWKIDKNNHKLFLAYHKISFSKNIHQNRHFKICSKQYEILRIENSKIKSIQTSGKNNPMFGIKRSKETLELIQRNRTKVVYTDELRNKLRKAHIGKYLGSLNPMFGKSPKNAKPVVINNVKYSSMNKAAINLNTTVYEIFKLLRSNNNDS